MKRQRNAAGNCASVLHHAVLFIAATGAVAAGCGTIGFKRGAGGPALLADEAACREQAADPAAVQSCMSERGWSIVGEARLAGSAEPVEETVRTAVPEGTPIVLERPVNPDPAPEAVAPSEPSTQVRVESWWKLGGTAAALDVAIDACVATLGAAHAPARPPLIVTAGLRDCLRHAGWRPLGERALAAD